MSQRIDYLEHEKSNLETQNERIVEENRELLELVASSSSEPEPELLLPELEVSSAESATFLVDFSLTGAFIILAALAMAFSEGMMRIGIGYNVV